MRESALWNDGNSGAGSTVAIGALNLHTKHPDGSWVTTKSKTLKNNTTNVFTDETFTPANAHKVRAEFTASALVSIHYPDTQVTKARTQPGSLPI